MYLYVIVMRLCWFGGIWCLMVLLLYLRMCMFRSVCSGLTVVGLGAWVVGCV